MNIHLAKHYGMCFGVRDAVESTRELATKREVTVLGELVHNPVVQEDLDRLGVKTGDLNDSRSSATKDVVITAHGASDKDRKRWANSGFRVNDTTCPLVKRAHNALGLLVARGFFPVIIGKRNHIEVKGLSGDFPHAAIIENPEDIDTIPRRHKLGIVSQTTQPIERVLRLVGQIEQRFPDADIEFKDTVCQPTKDRQQAVDSLCRKCEVVIVVGGANSNNTSQLARTVENLGVRAYHVTRADEIDPRWFAGVENVGITAGTSTLEQSVQQVVVWMRAIAASQAIPIANHRNTLATV